MTSYQNVSESEIKGYNDCPVLDYQRTSSSSSLKTRRRLVSHNNSSTTLTSNTSTTSLNGPTPIPRPSSVGLLKKTESQTSLSAPKVEDSEIPNEELLDKLKEILKLETSLQEREFKHYEKRLVDHLNKGLNNESHKKVLYSSLENYQNKEQVKNDLIKFMLVNDGVSTWCLPLRKILENVKM